MKISKPFCLWFTGLPSSGKTTTALALKDKFTESGINIVHLDGDVVRKGLNSDLGLSKEDREENNRRVIHVSEIVVGSGIPVISSFISPYKSTRDFAKLTIPNYIEVFVNTPLKECERRDVKGLYAKARAGEIKGLTGYDDPYEEPLAADIILDTVDHDLEENIASIMDYLKLFSYFVD